MSSCQVIPSVLENNIDGFLNQIKKLSMYFLHFQIDVGDGKYVPNKTVQIKEIKQFFIDGHQLLITNHLVFDFHLMVKDPETEIKKLSNWENKKPIKIGNILVHYSLKPSLKQLTAKYQLPIGLVLNTEDTVTNLSQDYNLDEIPIIQVMTVQAGAQNNPFLQENLEKIGQLKKAGFQGKIFVDGGINEKTLPIILSQKYQPDALCPGSYLTKTEKEQLKQRVSFLKKQLVFKASGQ